MTQPMDVDLDRIRRDALRQAEDLTLERFMGDGPAAPFDQYFQNLCFPRGRKSSLPATTACRLSVSNDTLPRVSASRFDSGDLRSSVWMRATSSSMSKGFTT